jgi:hypothetical protein
LRCLRRAAAVSVDGSRVAVLLLNGIRPGDTGFARSATAAGSLFGKPVDERSGAYLAITST